MKEKRILIVLTFLMVSLSNAQNTFPNNGNVGIGTLAPNSSLSITPNQTESKITLWDGGSSLHHAGIGVSSGQFNFHVPSSSSSFVFYESGKNGNGNELFKLSGSGLLSITPFTMSPKITLWSGGSSLNHAGFGMSFGQLNYHIPASNNSHVFYAEGNNGNGIELVRFLGNGTVGIGTSSPLIGSKLDVQGKIRINDGTQQAGYVLTSDLNGLASWQPASGTASNAWNTNGNSGLNQNAFIGTTDATPLVFKVNNQQVGKVGANFNTAFGFQAILNNTSGWSNSAFGYLTLNDNTTGLGNSAFGYYAMSKNVNGCGNSVLGSNALLNNINGNSNSAIGNMSLFLLRAGDFNTVIGDEAGINMIYGNNNTLVGSLTNLNDNSSNATALGYDAFVTTSNKIRLGNTAVTQIEGQVGFSTVSDGRFKENVTEDVKGVEFIMKLRPVVYNFNTKKFHEFLLKDVSDTIRKPMIKQDYSVSTSIRRTGFIAQEVKQAAEESHYDFSGIHTPQNDRDNYSLSYAEFVVPLVKAVQEQQSQINELKTEIQQLKEMLVNSKKEETKINTKQIDVDIYPNPVKELLTIEIEAEIKTVEIFNLQGQKVLSNNKKIVDVSSLIAGEYIVHIQDQKGVIRTKKIIKQ